MQNIDILFSTDDAYIKYLMVTLHSLFKNHTSDTTLTIHILDGGVSEENKKRVLSLSSSRHLISFIQIDTDKYQNLPETDHLSKATWYRILIPEVLPSLRKILYLDIDILVLKDIVDLYNQDISEYIVGAVKEPCEEKLFHALNEKGKNNTYFNAGVLLINLEAWRRNNLTKKCFSFIASHSDNFKKIFTCLDQDVLNAVLDVESIKFISGKYNFMLTNTNLVPRDTSILHFVAQTKPWSNATYLPKRNLWLTYGKDVLTTSEISVIKHQGLKKEIKKFTSDYIVLVKSILPRPVQHFLLRVKKLLRVRFY